MSDSSAETVVVDSATSQDQSVAASVATEAKDGNAAAASTAEAKPAETTFDRIKAAVTKSEESPSSKEPDPAVVADPASTTPDSDELSEDELKGLHVKTRERFGKLTSKLAAKDTEISSLAPKAAEYDKIDTFIKNAGLSPQDVGSTLQIAAMLRSEPAKARERLLPIMAELDRILGETLPAELQQRVDHGYLTQEDARALARSAAHAKLAEGRANQLTEQQRAEDAAVATKQSIDSTVGAVETWEKQKAEKDPDWHTKREEVAELVEIAIAQKARESKNPSYWPTAEESVKFSEDALKKVEARHKRFAPKPKAIDPPVTQGASPRSVAQPKNTLDIVRRIASGQ